MIYWQKQRFSAQTIERAGNKFMTNQMYTRQLASEIKKIYQTDRSQAEFLIEVFLENRLKALPLEKRLALLGELASELKFESSITSNVEEKDELLLKIFSLLLGRNISSADLSSSEVIRRLAQSLNTIFDTLNQLVGVINMTLFRERAGDETIRHVIGSHLERDDELKSLESYLGQIQKAFLITQQAFKKAAHDKVKEILHELDPNQIRAKSEGRFKFGALRKAEYFDMYEEKFHLCNKWFESGRFMEDFIRTFENRCQKLSD